MPEALYNNEIAVSISTHPRVRGSAVLIKESDSMVLPIVSDPTSGALLVHEITAGGSLAAPIGAIVHVVSLDPSFELHARRKCLVWERPTEPFALYESASPLTKMTSEIRKIVTDDDLRSDDEPPPTEHVVETMIMLLKEADAAAESHIPAGHVTSLDGQLSVTWDRDGAMVRLSVFETRPPLLQTSNILAPGSIISDRNPSGAAISDALAELESRESRELFSVMA